MRGAPGGLLVSLSLVAFLARITGGVPPSGQMDYDLDITLWYHEPAPETWSVLDGDT